MTYPDDVLKAAREAAAQYWERLGHPEAAPGHREGLLDLRPSVQAACIAIMAERQRYAVAMEALLTARQALAEVQHAQASGENWYTRGKSGLYQQVKKHVDKGREAINAALTALGQQETGNDRA